MNSITPIIESNSDFYAPLPNGHSVRPFAFTVLLRYLRQVQGIPEDDLRSDLQEVAFAIAGDIIEDRPVQERVA